MKRSFKKGNTFSKLSFTKIVFLGFALLVLLGSLLLMLPWATAKGEETTFFGALFTSTSATCVTGLIMYDTGTHWTIFGQTVIILLIQIGGLGFVTIISMFLMMINRKFGFKHRMMIMQSTGALQMGGILPYVKRIAKGTALFEGLGALLLAVRFVPRFGFWKGLYYSVFHSISAFCNAGFDLMGGFNSFVGYKGDVVVNLTIMMLIIIGGIGFFVWSDIRRHKLRFKEYRLHTKLVIVCTSLLVFGGAALFFVFESNASLAGMPVGEKILASLFQSVTMRTAGFNTVDFSKMSDSGSLLSVILMFIGGSPGSTAGGIKTTTIAILLLASITSARRKKEILVFNRKIGWDDVLTATAISTLYITIAFVALITISAIEPYSIKEILFEVISAENTVGVTMGITRLLSLGSQIIIMFLMFIGRIGGLTLALLFLEGAGSPPPVSRPSEKVLVG